MKFRMSEYRKELKINEEKRSQTKKSFSLCYPPAMNMSKKSKTFINIISLENRDDIFYENDKNLKINKILKKFQIIN